MSIIATGIAVIELDRAPIVPFSFQKRADDIGKYLNEDLLKDAGVDVTELKMALSEFYDVSSDVWSVIRATRNSLYADEINERLLGAAVKIMTKMQWVGGYIEEMYPHQHYLDDSWFLRESICSLEEGNIDRAMMWLSWVYGMYHGRWCSYENYKYMQLDRWNIDNFISSGEGTESRR